MVVAVVEHDAVVDVFADAEAADPGQGRIAAQRGEAQGPEGAVRVRKGEKKTSQEADMTSI